MRNNRYWEAKVLFIEWYWAHVTWDFTSFDELRTEKKNEEHLRKGVVEIAWTDDSKND